MGGGGVCVCNGSYPNPSHCFSNLHFNPGCGLILITALTVQDFAVRLALGSGTVWDNSVTQSSFASA